MSGWKNFDEDEGIVFILLVRTDGAASLVWRYHLNSWNTAHQLECHCISDFAYLHFCEEDDDCLEMWSSVPLFGSRHVEVAHQHIRASASA